jgi:hypothetical protein
MNLSELFIRRPVMTVLLNLAIDVLAGRVIGRWQRFGQAASRCRAAELRHAGDHDVFA